MTREATVWLGICTLAFIAIFYLVFFARWGSTVAELNEEHSEFITTTYESPITGDCFEIVQRHDVVAMSIQIDCELINE